MTETIIVTLFTAGISAIGYMLARYSQNIDNELTELKKQNDILKNELARISDGMVTKSACENRSTRICYLLQEKINKAIYVAANGAKNDKE